MPDNASIAVGSGTSILAEPTLLISTCSTTFCKDKVVAPPFSSIRCVGSYE